MALGLAHTLGFKLPNNFNAPYLAASPADFWRRWHISLSRWLRDYLYITLGGNRGGALRTYRNLSLTMLLGGLWHGASWNFIWWGAFHGALLCGHRLVTGGKQAAARGGLVRFGSMLLMFQFTLFGWLLFRCTRRVEGHDDSFAQIVEILTAFQNGWGLNLAALQLVSHLALLAVPLLLLEWY